MLKIEWLKQLSAWNTAGADIAPSIVADPSDGSLYCAFQTSGTMSGGYNEGGSAIAVCKISSEGHVLWTHQNQFNTSVNEFAPRIALGPAGGSPPSSNQQIYIAFTTNGTVSGGELNMGGSKQDVVVMRLAGATGQLIWLKQLNAMNSSEEESEPSIIYYNENVYVAYTTLGVVSGGSPAGGADIVIAKLDGSTGELLALRQDNYNTMAADTSPALAEDSGNIFVAYVTAGAVSGQTPAGGASDVVVAKMDSSTLMPAWFTQYPISSAGADSSVSLSTASGMLYIAYLTDSAVSGGLDTAAVNLAIQALSAADGSITWTYQQTDINPAAATATSPQVANDSAGNVYCAYVTDKSVSGGVYQGSTDIAFLKLSKNGVLLELRQSDAFNTPALDAAPAISVIDNIVEEDTGTAQIYIAYTTAGTVSGGTAAGGSSDIAIMRYTDTYPVPPFPGTTADVESNFVSYIGVDDEGYVYTANFHNPTVNSYVEKPVTTRTAICKVTSDGFQVWRKEVLDDKFTIKARVNGSGDVFLLYLDTSGSSSGPHTFEYLTDNTNGFSICRVSSSGNVTTWAADILSGFNPGTLADMAFDQNGSCFVVASIDDVVSGGTGSGETDVVVCKLGADGTELWRKQLYNTYLDDELPRIAADNSGHIILTYMTRGTISGGNNIGDYDIVIFKLDTDGTLLYSLQGALLDSADDDVLPIVGNDISNNIYISAVLPGNFRIQKYKPALESREFMVDISINYGAYAQGIENGFYTYDYVVDPSGYSFLAYFTDGSVSGGQSSSGLTDVVLTCIKPDGQVHWVKQNNSFNTVGWDIFPSLAVKGDYVYLTFTTDGVVSGGTTSPDTQYDIVIAKFSRLDGSVQWIIQNQQINFPEIYTAPQVTWSTVVNTAENENLPNIKADQDGNSYITFFSPSPISGGTASGLQDIILCKMDACGSRLWNFQNSQINTEGGDYSFSMQYKFDEVYILASDFFSYAKIHRINSDGTYLGNVDVNSASSFNFAVDNGRNIIYNVTGTGVAKINLSGQELWSYNGIPAGSEVKCITTDAVDKSIVLYTTSGDELRLLTLESDGSQVEDSSIALDVLNVSDPFGLIYKYQAFASGDTIAVDYLDSSANLQLIRYGNKKKSYVFDKSRYFYPREMSVDNNGNTFLLVQQNGKNPPAFEVYKFNSNLQVVWRYDFTSYFYFGEITIILPTITATDDGCILVRHTVGNNNDFSTVVEKLGIANFNSIQQDWQQPLVVSDTYDLTVDSNGDLIVAYRDSSEDIILTKLNTTGDLEWNVSGAIFNTGQSEYTPSIACDAARNVYLTYVTDGEISGGQQTGGADIVVAKLEYTGNVKWLSQANTFNTASGDYQPRISVDDSGNSYVAYYTQGTVSGGEPAGDTDIVVFKFNTAGSFQWASQQPTFNTIGKDLSPRISATRAGCYVAFQSPDSENAYVFFVSAEGVYQGWRNQYTSNFACDIVADKDGYCYVAIDYKLEKLDTLGNVLYSVDSAFSNPRIFMGGDNLFVSSPNATDDNTDIFYKINPATGDVILTDENYPDWPFNTDAIGADTSGNVYRAYTSDAGILTVQRLKQVALDTPATPTTQADVSGYFSALFSDNPGPFTNDFQLAVKRQLCGLGLAATQITAPVEFPKLFKPGDGAYLAKNIIVLFPDNPALSTEQVLQMLDRETFLYIPANIGKLLTVMFGTIPVEFIFNADTITINGITVSIPEGYPYSGERGVDAIYYIDIGGGLNLWYSHIGSGLFGLFSSTTPVVPCFTKNASVLVPGGYLPIDKVKRGQIVITGDGRRVAVKSVRKWVVPAGKDSYPYLLPAGKYGAKKTVEVSGDHRIYSGAPGKFRLTSGRWNQSEFKAVSELPGLRRRVTRGSVTWYNIVLPDYYRDTLVVDGVIAESLQHIGFRLMSMRDWNIVRKQISTPQASRAIISGSSVMVPYEY